MNRPRVTASHDAESSPLRTMCGGIAIYPPSVHVEVSFDLHDHENALRDLEFAVARVREQIEETK